MPDALISRITSRGPGVGSGNSLSSSLRSPRNTTPFMVLLRCAVFGEARSDAPAALDRPAPKQARHGQQRGSARGQIQKITVGKFHVEPSLYFTSFDHLVGAGEHCRRNIKVKRLGSLEVDHRLIFSWRLYWQIGRLLALGFG